MKTKQYIQPLNEVTNIPFSSVVCVSPLPPRPDIDLGGEGDNEMF